MFEEGHTTNVGRKATDMARLSMSIAQKKTYQDGTRKKVVRKRLYKKKMDGGYIMLYMPEHPSCNSNGCIPEHRYVMEQHLGRLLLRTEIVHHKNKDKLDNRIENLQLFDRHYTHLIYHQNLLKNS